MTIPPTRTIEIPSINLPLTVRAALALADVSLPSKARSLHKEELDYAKEYYGESLDYDLIYISDGIGAKQRPVTVAIPMGNKWIVILNLGWLHGMNIATLSLSKHTLIHELAHAWQSQHHSNPLQFMVNCAKSQAAAAAASLAVRAADNPYVGPFVEVPLGDAARQLASLGPADAYSYVAGYFFGDYGGEQIAQQVEDIVKPPAPPKHRPLTVEETASIRTIAAYMKNASKGQVIAENVRSLSTVRYAHQNSPHVIWHEE